MKKIILLFFVIGCLSGIRSQAPQFLNYQGVARDAGGTVINSGNIGLRFEILQGSPTGVVVYKEEKSAAPSSAGIFTTAIGSGTNTIGTFSSINWAAGPYFIRVGIDETGGTFFNTAGTSQLLSVPYALYAETAGNSAATYSAGTGISISSGSIINTSPDQPVTIAQSGIVNVSGTYPAFTVGVVTPTISGAGVSGSWPSYTITSGASTLTPVTGIQINSPHTASTVSPGNFSITVQPTSLSGAGVAAVSGSYPSYTVTVPPPAVSVSGNSITVTQGTASSTQTFAAGGPWTYTSGVLHPSTSVANDKVAIGKNTAASMLDVLNSAASTTTTNPVATISNVNSSFNGASVLHVNNSANVGSVILAEQNGGAGTVIDANTTGTGAGVSAVINNTVNTANAIIGNTNGTGYSGYFTKSGSGAGLYSVHSGTGTTSHAASFNIFSFSSMSSAVYAQTIGNGDAIGAYNVNQGRALFASAAGSLEAIFATNVANGRGLIVQNMTAAPIRAALITGGLDIVGKSSSTSTFPLLVSNSTAANLFNVRDDGNVGISAAIPNNRLTVVDGGSGNATLFANQTSAASSGNAHGVSGMTSNTHTFAAGVIGESTGNGPSVFGIKSTGNGVAGRFEISAAGNSAAAMLARTAGGGPAVHAMTSTVTASALSLLVEGGHIKALGPPTTVSNTSVGGGFSAITGQTVAGNDVRGSVTFSTGVTGFLATNFAEITIAFAKPYAVTPNVYLTPLSDMQNLDYMVINATTAGFTIRIYRSGNATVPASVPSSQFRFNYIVIE